MCVTRRLHVRVCVCLVLKQSETCVLDPRLNAGWINFATLIRESFLSIDPLYAFRKFSRESYIRNLMDEYGWRMPIEYRRYCSNLELQLDRKHGD
jgi:hypothetical protein